MQRAARLKAEACFKEGAHVARIMDKPLARTTMVAARSLERDGEHKRLLPQCAYCKLRYTLPSYLPTLHT